jgi:hypothetical protein
MLSPPVSRKERPAARGGKILPFMVGEGGRGGQLEVEKNLLTLYPIFESRPPLGWTCLRWTDLWGGTSGHPELNVELCRAVETCCAATPPHK